MITVRAFNNAHTSDNVIEGLNGFSVGAARVLLLSFVPEVIMVHFNSDSINPYINVIKPSM